MAENVIKQVRPHSTFDRYDPKTEKQREALALISKLANSICDMDTRFPQDRYPFKSARMLVISGPTGRGKSHLLEALINHLAKHAPNAYEATYLARRDITLDNIAGYCGYNQKPILVLDDLYAKKHSLADLNPLVDIPVFMDFVMHIYEERRLVIMATNFPFLNGIVERIRPYDLLERVTSRLEEIVARSFGEIEIDGPNGREVDREGEDLFDL